MILYKIFDGDFKCIMILGNMKNVKLEIGKFMKFMSKTKPSHFL